MQTLRKQDRGASMTNLVCFHAVRMPRGPAFAISHIEARGAPVAIFSADRTLKAIVTMMRSSARGCMRGSFCSTTGTSSPGNGRAQRGQGDSDRAMPSLVGCRAPR
jgi:hypothetical protein